MSEEIIFDKNFELIIVAYRKSLIRRYSVENLSRFKELEKVDRATIDKLVHYFLELLYPPYSTRLELDNAFHSLGGFINTPAKLFGVLGNIGYAIVKFGKLLLRAMHAGIAALKSYLAAHKFEKELYQQALPYIEAGKDISEEDIFNSLIGKIPKEEADAFREQVVNLFRFLAKKDLLEKIQQVMLHVIAKMERKKHIYTESDLKGIRMGYDIIEKGKEVFSILTDEEIALTLKGIDMVEKDFFDRAASIESH
jgi:hypothetical protein